MNIRFLSIAPQRDTKLMAVSVVSLVIVGLSYWAGQNDWTNQSSIKLGTFTITQYVVLAMCMFAAWYWSSNSNKISDHLIVIAVAVALRLILVGVEPYSSNDIDRYMFDGKIALEGYDPYRTPHDHPDLAQLRQEWQPPAEHAKYVTIYPPLAIASFALSATAGIETSKWVWKALLTIASLVSLALMVSILSQLGKLRHLSLFAFSPIAVFEVGIGAHVDTLSTLMICAGIYFLLHSRTLFSGAVLGVGALLKLTPLLLVFPLFFLSGQFKNGFKLVIASAITVVLGYLLAFAIGWVPFGSTGVFFEKWRFSSPIFSLLEGAFSGITLFSIILLIACLGYLIIAVFAWRMRGDGEHFSKTIVFLQWALAIPFLLSPVVFPWYLMPLAALVAIRPSIFFLAWMTAFPFVYEVLSDFACCDKWAPQKWPQLVLSSSMLLGLLVELFFLQYINQKRVAYVVRT